MSRGRKKKENALTETISIKINEKQKEVLKNNPWIKKELDKQVRDHIKIYMS